MKLITDPELKHRLYREENYRRPQLYTKSYINFDNEYYIVRAMDCYTLAENWPELVLL